MEEKVKGHLTINVQEAAGLNKGQESVWDSTFTEGFVKVEIRGGPRNVKVQTKIRPVSNNAIVVNEELKLEVLEGANELRLMLCKEKKGASRTGSSVVAACGIYVSDILEAVPIDKYFELFKPKNGGDGGFIRIAMDFESAAPAGQPLLGHSLTMSREGRESSSQGGSGGGFPWKVLLGAGALALGAVLALGVAGGGKKEEDKAGGGKKK